MLNSIAEDEIRFARAMPVIRRNRLLDAENQQQKFIPSLENDMETSCGHGFPNKISDLLDDSDINIPKFEEKMIMLRKDYKIYEDQTHVRTWSFVYGQSNILYYKNSIFYLSQVCALAL